MDHPGEQTLCRRAQGVPTPLAPGDCPEMPLLSTQSPCAPRCWLRVAATRPQSPRPRYGAPISGLQGQAGALALIGGRRSCPALQQAGPDPAQHGTPQPRALAPGTLTAPPAARSPVLTLRALLAHFTRGAQHAHSPWADGLAHASTVSLHLHRAEPCLPCALPGDPCWSKVCTGAGRGGAQEGEGGGRGWG